MRGWVGGRDGRTEGRTDLGLLLLNAQLEARGEAVNVDGGVDDGEVEARELLELEEGVAQHVHVDLHRVCRGLWVGGTWVESEDDDGVIDRRLGAGRVPEKSMSMCGELSSRQTM